MLIVVDICESGYEIVGVGMWKFFNGFVTRCCVSWRED